MKWGAGRWKHVCFFFFPICLNSDDCRAETSKWLFHKQSVMTYQEAKKSCLIRGSIVAISSNTLISQHSSDVISTHRHHYRCIPQQVWNLVGFKAAGQEKKGFVHPWEKRTCNEDFTLVWFRKTHSLRLSLSLPLYKSIFMSLILLSETLFLPLNQFCPWGLIKLNWIEHELKQIWRCEGSVASLFTYWNEI